jgi:hypothetical protein
VVAALSCQVQTSYAHAEGCLDGRRWGCRKTNVICNFGALIIEIVDVLLYFLVRFCKSAMLSSLHRHFLLAFADIWPAYKVLLGKFINNYFKQVADWRSQV